MNGRMKSATNRDPRSVSRLRLGAFVGSAAIGLLALCILTALLYQNFQDRLRGSLRERLHDVVALGALQIDAGAHRTLTDPADEGNATYLLLQGKMQAVRDSATGIRSVYTMRKGPNGEILFVVDAETKPEDVAHLGETSDHPGLVLSKEFPSLSRPVVEDEFYTDKFGTWLSGYAPFYGDDGQRAGVMGVDISAATILAQERRFLLVALAVFGSVIPFLILAAYGLSRRLARAAMKARETLRESEETYRNLLTNLNSGVVVHAPDTSILLSNPAAAEMLGLSKEQMAGKQAMDPQWKFLREDGSDMPLEEYPVRQILSSNEPLRNLIVGVNRPQQGDTAWVLVNGFPEHRNSGQIDQIVITFVDITERKKAETALRESEAFIRTVMDSLPLGIAVNSVDPKVEFSYMNDNFVKYYRTTREALANPNEFWDTVYEDSEIREEIKKRVLDDCASGDPARMYWPDVPISRKGEETTFISARNTPIPSRNSVISTVMDITERKKAEAEKERLMAAINQAAETIVITDIEGTIEYVNPAFERITGYTREEAIGRNPRILKSGKHDAEFYTKLWSTLLRGEIWGGRFINKKKDGTLYTEEATVSPVKDSAGKVVNYVAVKRDITKEIKLEDQVRQAQKMDSIGRLAGGIAHDFNNQLQGIMGFAEILRARLDKEDLQNYADSILVASRRSADLTKKLLAFSRQGQYEFAPVDLHDIIHEVVAILDHSIDKRIKVQQVLKARPATVMGDSSQIQNAILNLAINASQAMPEGGTLTFDTEIAELDEDYCRELPYEMSPGTFLRVCVSDTGCGIPKENLQKIFEPFFTTKEVGKGTGMGLAAVYGTVKHHNGEINVYSEVGQGTTFRIHLPLAKQEASCIEPGADITKTHQAATILVVDDEEVLRNLAEQMLQILGYTVETADDGESALAYFKDHWQEVDLVVLDLMMPIMNGSDAYREMKSINPDVKVVLASGYSINGVAKELLAEGAQGFLQKPFNMAELSNMITTTLAS